MIAQVHRLSRVHRAVRIRSPLSRRSRLKVLTALAMLSSAIPLAVDERTASHSPSIAALLLSTSRRRADLLDSREVEVGLDLRGLLGPGDPESVRRG